MMKTLLAITFIAPILFHGIQTQYLQIELNGSDQLPKAPGWYENKSNAYLKFVM